jgi:potassium efflux system protein
MERSNPKKQRYLAVRWPIFCLLGVLALSSPASSQIRLIPPTPNQNSQQPGTAQQNPVAQPGFSSPVAPAAQISPPIARTAQAPTNASVRDSQPDQTANTNSGSVQNNAIPSTAPAAATAQSTTAPASTGAPTATAAPVSDVTTITQDSIAAYLQQIQALPESDAVLKQSLTSIYESLLAELKGRAENEKFYKELLAAYEAAPIATAEAKKRKENPAQKVIFSGDLLPSSSIETLQSFQLELQAQLQGAIDGRARIEAATVSRDAQKKELPRLILESKASTTKINEELNAPVAEGSDPRLREATMLLLRARLVSLNERVRRMEQEQRTYDAENELLSLQKAIFISDEKYYQSKVKEVTEELNKRREILIANQKRLAERLAQQSVPECKSQADQIVKRTDSWLTLAKQNSILRVESDASKLDLKLWSDRFRIMTERISPESARHVSNFNSWVGLMLRKQRNELPDVGELQQKLYDYQQKIFATETLILELDDWKAASNATSEPSNLNSESISQFANSNYRDQVRLLDTIEHKVVDEFRVDANSHFDSLFNLAETTQQTIDQVKKYRAFIDEHVLWIRSSEPMAANDVKQIWPTLQWLFHIQNWLEIPTILAVDIQKHAWIYGIGSIIFLLMVFNLRRMKNEEFRQGELAARPNCMTFSPTLKSIIACVVLSTPLALLHLVAGWRLHNAPEGKSFAEAIGMGLLVSARYFFPLELLRQICRAGGLAESHFNWSPTSTQLLRKNLRWFIDLAIPCVCVVGVLSHFGESRFENSLGRITYCVLMALCTAFLSITLHPHRGVFREFLLRNANGWIDRLKYLWYVGLAWSPVALIAMSLLGYHYTSVRLSMHLHTTFVALIGILLLSNIIHRWLLLRRRQILVSQAKQRMEDARKRAPDIVPMNILVLDNQTDLSEINAQTMRLVSSTLIFASIAAVAFIWSAVLPAVGVLDTVKLGWSVEGATPNQQIPITLTHLLIAIPTGVMTVVAARNLPGLLEIALLQHLPLENAVRYAISSISRYAILILGLLMTFNSIGVRWSSIQWLVAALGVGLGFGLQEIFANFVSGLILLFEQPVRVGDVISLGETTGTVSRIRMRATTVTNFDQQELIIPNKDLVTGRLLNWTLSDSTNRIVIQVGIAYESDPEMACALIREVCLNHPNVMQEPAPTAFFEQFGDSTLNINVRFFLAKLDLRLPTRHELLVSIRKRFADSGIEIAFPQRDLHIKSVPTSFATALQTASNTSNAPNQTESRQSNERVA